MTAADDVGKASLSAALNPPPLPPLDVDPEDNDEDPELV
jgi:hypothetical protein